MGRLLAALVIAVAFASSLGAQQLPFGEPQAPQILVIDPNRLFVESAYAEQLGREVEELAATIQAENQQIVDQLVAEERSLTEQRPTMSPEDFKAAADAFDEKAQAIRAARDAKEAELDAARRGVRDQFLADVRNVLGQVMAERGASIVMDSRSVYIALTSADITDDVIARVDAQFLDPAAQ